MNTQTILTLSISAAALIVSISTFIYTSRQIHFIRRQIRVDVDFKVYAVHRELIKLALDSEDLLDVLDDRSIQNPLKQHYFIQLWINHIDMMWFAWKNRMISESTWYAIEKDVKDFFGLNLVQAQWREVKGFYRPDFVQFVSQTVELHASAL